MDVGIQMIFSTYGWPGMSDREAWQEEIRLARLMEAYEFAIEQQRRAAGGQSEHGVGFFSHEPHDDPGGEAAGGFRVRLNDDFHAIGA